MLSPGWASVRVLAWMAAASAAVAAALMWLNVRGFGAALTEMAAWRMTAGAIATSASAAVLLGIAIAHYSFGRRGSRVGASLFAIAVIASLALPLAARGPAVRASRPVAAGIADGNRRAPSALAGTARHHAPARRRVARLHPAAGRRGPAAGVRPAARKRAR